MKQSKKVMAILLSLVMVLTMLPMTVFAAETPSVSVSSAEAKPGEEVTLTVNIANRPDLMAMTFTVEYDEEVLEKVSYTGSGMGGGSWDTSGKTLLWYNMSGDTVFTDGQILELKYKVKGGAPAGDTEVKVTVKENYNWDEDTFTFTANAGKVVVAACEHPTTTTTYTQVSGTQTHTGTTVCDICKATTATIPAADCTDADNNQKCDTCSGDVLPAEMSFPFELTVDGTPVDIEVLTTSETCGATSASAIMLKVVLPKDAQTLGMSATVGCNILTRVNGCSGSMSPYNPSVSMSYDLSNGIDTLCLNIAGSADYNGKCYHIVFEEEKAAIDLPFELTVDGAPADIELLTDSETCGATSASAIMLKVALPKDAQTLGMSVTVGCNILTRVNGCSGSMTPYNPSSSMSYDLNNGINTLCLNIAGSADYNGKCYHIVFETEVPRLRLPFTMTIDGEAVTAEANGENGTCSMYGYTEIPIKITLPQSAKGKTLVFSSTNVNGDVTPAHERLRNTYFNIYTGAKANYTLPQEPELVCIAVSDNRTAYHLTVEYEGGSETPAVDGYTVTMPADISIVAGETVSVPVVVDNKDGSAYNAFDMAFTYDASKLELTSTEIDGMTVEVNDGTVRVLRYGEDLDVGAAAFTLTFKAIGTGETTVTATSAKVGVAATATELDAADATILDDATVVTIGGYSVTLPDDFTGDGVVAPGADYTFTAKDKNYNYTVTATMGGQNVDVKDNDDGSFTIEDVSGNLVITSTKEGKTFGVTLGEDMTGNPSAQYMTPYTATLTKVDGYTYDLKVTIGGKDYTGFTYDEATGVVTIPGADITGKIEFNSNKTQVQPSEYTVTFEGNGAGDAVGENKVAAGADYSFTLNKAEGCTYTVSYKMGDSTESVALTEADGKYTIAKVNGNLVITVEKESDLAVEVGAYVEMDGKTVFLVRATGTLAEGKAYAYDGNAMYYSNVYKAWSYLVIVDEGNTFTADDAKAMITAVEAEYTTLDQTFDVNMTDKVDVNDAQLVYNFYNCEYNDFSVAPMLKFLNADVNGDMIVDTLDAAAVVNAVINGAN